MNVRLILIVLFNVIKPRCILLLVMIDQIKFSQKIFKFGVHINKIGGKKELFHLFGFH